MKTLSPDYYFNLSLFAHAELFKDCVHVWEALMRINTYLLNLPLGKIEVDVPHGTFLINPEQISIGKGTVLEPGAYIKGPCVKIVVCGMGPIFAEILLPVMDA